MRRAIVIGVAVLLAGCASAAEQYRDRMVLAGQKVDLAGKDCRANRLAGEVKGYAGSVACSNPLIVSAMREAGYPYMDLVTLYTASRAVFAERADRGEMTEAEMNAAMAQAQSDATAEASRRDLAARSVAAQQDAARAANIGAAAAFLSTRPAPQLLPVYQPPPQRVTNCFPGLAGGFNCTSN